MDGLSVCLLVCGCMLPNLVLNTIYVQPKGSKKYWDDEPYYPPTKPREQIASSKFVHVWFSFIVAIQRRLQVPNAQWFHSCSGSVVSAKVVLSSCQCVGKETKIPEKMNHFLANWARVVAGSPDSRHSQIVDVQSFKAHPLCKNTDNLLAADLGLVFLMKAFVFNQAVQPLEFFSLNALEAREEFQRLVEAENNCFTPGWGSSTSTAFNGTATTVSIHPSITVLRLMPEHECNEKFCSLHNSKCRVNFSEYNQVCVMGSAESTSCFSDIGGPLICNEYVFGVASWTVDHCITHSPNVFTDIKAVQDFLNLEGLEYRSKSLSNWENKDVLTGQVVYSNSAPFILGGLTTFAGFLLKKIS